MAQTGIQVKRSEDFSEWYVQAITRAELIEYTDISGCIVFRPWAFAIWEEIQAFFDGEIKKLGVKNAYFPCFVSQKALKAEEDHLEGFKPEVAWVTKSGDSDLAEPLALRPTSETIMYPMYSKWIRSHRDLPLKLNQWCNVVRWEFKHPVPFLRTREFLWQEGHSAFSTKAEADEEVLQILDLYRQVFEDLLAVPVTRGKKTDKEKFAGGLYTTTCEAFIQPNGRAIQAATSHCLGQNFAKIFNITIENENNEKALVWQNSWGLTTRSIGIMLMVHGDDRGLILPPRIAPVQVIIVPVYTKTNSALVNAKCNEIVKLLVDAGIRAEADLRDNYKSGWKYNHWELKGVPVRVEIGQKDIEKAQVMAVRRDNSQKAVVPEANLVNDLKDTLINIQKSLFEKAKKLKDEHTKSAETWEQFLVHLNNKNIVKVPFCCTADCEGDVKVRSAAESKAQATDEKFELTGSAKSLCIPFEQDPLKPGTPCFACKKVAEAWTFFGRSY
uniref:proline--tRNA ligase n=1 Tax=Arcella intermedia TaxID=1963864 RepID=A0A6B2L2B1_9EUKA